MPLGIRDRGSRIHLSFEPLGSRIRQPPFTVQRVRATLSSLHLSFSLHRSISLGQGASSREEPGYRTRLGFHTHPTCHQKKQKTRPLTPNITFSQQGSRTIVTFTFLDLTHSTRSRSHDRGPHHPTVASFMCVSSSLELGSQPDLSPFLISSSHLYNFLLTPSKQVPN